MWYCIFFIFQRCDLQRETWRCIILDRLDCYFLKIWKRPRMARNVHSPYGQSTLIVGPNFRVGKKIGSGNFGEIRLGENNPSAYFICHCFDFWFLSGKANILYSMFMLWILFCVFIDFSQTAYILEAFKAFILWII